VTVWGETAPLQAALARALVADVRATIEALTRDRDEARAHCALLRQEQILHHGDGTDSCFACALSWPKDEPELHDPGCVAAPVKAVRLLNNDADMAELPDLGPAFNRDVLWRHHLAALAADGWDLPEEHA
jgi:hypothetical protein